MGQYANNTTVSPEKSQSDIRDTLRRYGAEGFEIMEKHNRAYVVFEFGGLMIQLTVDLPKKEEFEKTSAGRARKTKAINDAYTQAVRQCWRALLLAIKAKLEAIECKISTIEKEFMAFVIMPDGRSLGDHIIPKLQDISKTGKLPKLLTYTGD